MTNNQLHALITATLLSAQFKYGNKPSPDQIAFCANVANDVIEECDASLTAEDLLEEDREDDDEEDLDEDDLDDDDDDEDDDEEDEAELFGR